MANPAHEALLRQGVDEWNDWRSRNGSVTPDLSSIRMPAAKLRGADLSHARLTDASLVHADLAGADLRYADLCGAELHDADLTDADLFRANLERAVLASATLRRARCYAANLTHAQVTAADLRRADLRSALLTQTDLRESRGAGASLEEADLSGAKLGGCDLRGCNLLGARGLLSRQIERAQVDAETLLPETFGTPATEALESLRRTLRSLKARATGCAVLDTELSRYHAVLDALAACGIDTESARFGEGELIRPATDQKARPWVDAASFRRRLDELLDALEGP